MTKAIYFDMDGTIADLYGVEGWLNDLESENERPYATAKPLIRMSALARVLNRLQKNVNARFSHKTTLQNWWVGNVGKILKTP